ncbi:MAG: protein kinase [Pseudomonadota bacterium]
MKTTDLFSGTSVNPPGAGSENCLRIGTRLDDYEITGILGEGGFGIVYIAFDHALQRSVAIKEYMPGALAARAPDQSVAVRTGRHQDTFNVGLKSFINEARFLAQFDHPALVKVHRFWEQNRTAYTAMRYYDGRTIKDIVAHNPELVTDAWCRQVIGQILEALEMLYTMNILHRDVSPDNIIVQENGEAVLLDFGSARQIIGDMTRGLTVILKPGYAPIEQYSGDASLEQGAWTDIYALASLMYFAIAKEAPATSIARMVKDPITPLAVRAPAGFGADLLAAIDKGMAVLPQERPQSIDAFRAMLGIVAPNQRARTGPAMQRAPSARSVEPKPVTAVPYEPEARTQPGPAAPVPPPATPKNTTQEKAAATPSRNTPAKGASPLTPARVAIALIALAGIGAGVFFVMGSGPDPVNMAQEPSAPAPAGPELAPPEPALAAEEQAWNKLRATPDAGPSQLNAFLEQYPAGTHAQAARARLAALQAPAAAPEPAPLAMAAPAAPAVVPEAAPAVVPEAAPAEPPAELSASYTLAIKPWGTVYVDGKERGVTPPLKRLVLSAGKHQIRVVNPNFSAFMMNVDITSKKGGTIAHDFSATRK